DDVKKVLKGLGMDPEKIIERATTGEGKERLRSSTNEAIARGAFGVPTVFVDDELYWGNDQFEYIRRHIEGKDVLDPSIKAMLEKLTDLPRGSDRKRFRELSNLKL